MARGNEIASSLPGQVAQNIVGSTGGATTLTATGTNLATALTLPYAVNNFSTVAASTGCVFQTNELPGTDIWIYNGGANALTVYTPSGETINAAATSFSLSAGAKAVFKKINGTIWMSIVSA